MRARIAQHRANPVVRELPRDDGSAGAVAREFRHGGTMARRRRGAHADRRVGRAARRHEIRRPCGPSRRPVERSRSVRQDADGEDADLCARPRPRVLRHAGRAENRARHREGTTTVRLRSSSESSTVVHSRCGGGSHDRHQDGLTAADVPEGRARRLRFRCSMRWCRRFRRR